MSDEQTLLEPTSDGLPNVQLRVEQFDSAVRAAIEAIDPAGDYDNIIRLHGWVKAMKAVLADAAKLTDAKFIESLHAHGTDGRPDEIQVGEIRYYEGATKRVTPNSNADVAEAVLESTGGDFGALAECLASQPWKHATVRDKIGEERYAQLFDTDYMQDLKTGKPKKGLKVVNTTFTQPHRAPTDAR